MGIEKKIKFILLGLVVFLLAIGVIVYLLVKPKIGKEVPPAPAKEKSMEEVLKSLTAPAGQGPVEIPKAVIKSLTAPAGKAKAVPEDVLKSLTAPE